MKLSTAQAQRTSGQFEADPIPDTHPAMAQLHQLFGDHTFFLGNDGLCVVERAERAQGEGTAKVIKLATWKDEQHTSLLPCEPEETDLVVVIDVDEPGGAA